MFESRSAGFFHNLYKDLNEWVSFRIQLDISSYAFPFQMQKCLTRLIKIIKMHYQVSVITFENAVKNS